MKFASEGLKLRDETHKSANTYRRIEGEISKNAVSAEYIESFIHQLACEVKSSLAEDYKRHVKERRAVLRGDFEEYQRCVSGWVERVQGEIEAKAREIAGREGVQWKRLEQGIGKMMMFTRFKLAVPVLNLEQEGEKGRRKLSEHSQEEIAGFVNRLKRQKIPFKPGLSPQIQAKIAESLVEDEVWLTFNIELAQVNAFFRGK